MAREGPEEGGPGSSRRKSGIEIARDPGIADLRRLNPQKLTKETEVNRSSFIEYVEYVG